MENVNQNVILIGVFLATLVIIGSVFGAFTLLSSPQKTLLRRLQRFRARFSPNRPLVRTDTRSIMLNTKGSSLDQFFRQFVPRPAELRVRLAKTGKNITLGKYALFSLGFAVVMAGFFAFFLGFSVLLSLLLSVFLGIGLPHFVVSRMIAKRLLLFTKLFPDAIDLIVRGLKSGLPVTESIAAVSREIPDPVGVEFRKIADSVKLGKTLEDALWEAAERLDTPDFKFFVISLSVQKETGGNLAETLGNLSDILRKRHQMKLKIKSMSSEGKASAYIVGSLPFIMFGMILMINYGYASVLFTDQRAIIVSIGGLIWMAFGGLIMAKMINFEI